MALSYEDAIDKVKKLLKLTSSTNFNEAASAAARAQEIMDKYNISKLAIEEANGVTDNKVDIVDSGLDNPVDSGGKLTQWRMFLIIELSRANGCSNYINRSYKSKTSVCIIGEKNDIQTVNYLYKYFSSEIDRLTVLNCSGRGRIYSNNYRIGAVTAIRDRLSEQHLETVKQIRGEQGNNATALMVIDKAITKHENKINEAMRVMKEKKNLKGNYKSSGFVHNHEAREHGYSDGRKINMSK